VPHFLTDAEHRTLRAVMDRLIPGDEWGPGAGEAGAADYVDLLLGAFAFDPPRIWAGGPFSGRHGGDPGFDRWLELGPTEELAWRIRIEGSQGRPERSFNGPVIGWQERYRSVLAALGDDLADLPPDRQSDRIAGLDESDRTLLYTHACEAHYGDPTYGGNRDGAAWQAIGFDGDVLPRGWTDAEVSGP
jgi:gluconate 2-dehydrogenase subunit 3-like protein